MNDWEQKVQLLWLEEEDETSSTRAVALPQSPFTLDSCDAGSLQAQAAPARTAFEDPADDGRFLYKKMESFAIVKIAVDLEEVDIDQTEVSFSLLMKINTLIYKKEPLEIPVPVFINIGKVKRLPV